MGQHLPKLHTQGARWAAVDALRGVAMVWMTLFHFCFDLNQAGYIHQNFYTDPVWTWQRTCILGLFLLCAGAGQAIALQQGQSWRRFWRRLAEIGGCALLVSAGSALMFGKTFIYFGVLHGMVCMLVIARLSASWGRWLWPLGGLAVASKFIAPYAISTWPAIDFLNEPGWNVLGFISRLPVTQDYVPILPWLGVMWWGMAACQWWLVRNQAPMKPAASRSAGVHVLAKLGRWSLTYYMLHQPVLLAGLWLFRQF